MRKGSFVFSYLSIYVEYDSTFAVMDVFTIFDRTGRGKVFIEDFVVGVMEKIFEVRNDSVLLEDIANELISCLATPNAPDLLVKMEKGRLEESKVPKYITHLIALSYVIQKKIKEYHQDSKSPVITSSSLVNTFQMSIDDLARNVMDYFHIPTNALLADNETAGTGKVELEIRI